MPENHWPSARIPCYAAAVVTELRAAGDCEAETRFLQRMTGNHFARHPSGRGHARFAARDILLPADPRDGRDLSSTISDRTVMDLPTCPACGQSVIDDDAAECPFCGASMSGKPSAGRAGTAAPKARKAAGKSSGSTAGKAAAKEGAKTSGKPAGTKAASKSDAGAQAGRSAAAKPTRAAEPDAGRSGDDDPFAVDTSAHSNVLQALPKPAKGRLHKVVCPMCETPGFIPKKAAGREVRCANKECLVPIFKTKPIEEPKPEAVEEETDESSASPLKMYLAIAGVVVLLAGGGWYWFQRANPTEVRIDVPEQPSGTTSIASANEQEDNSTKSDESPEQPAPEPQVDWSGMRQSILEQSVEAARQSKSNRSKPFCRQMTAEAFALAGEFANAENEIEQLAFVGRQVKYLQMAPLSVVAWEQMARGDEAAARDAVGRARSLTDQLPTWGRTPIDLSTQLAAVLAATNQLGPAESLLREHKADRRDSSIQLSAYLQLQQADEYSRKPLQLTDRYGDWYAPQWVAVTLTLCAHDEFDVALQWVQRASDITARAEAAAAWARRVAAAPGQTNEQIEQLLGTLSPSGAARVAASVGEAFAARGDADAAAGWVARAQSLLEGVEVPPPMTMPSVGATTTFKMPDPAPMWLASVAAADLAAAHMQLQQPDAAWELVTRSLAYARAGAPNVSVVRTRQSEVASSPASVGNTLRRELRLANNDRVQRALREYRRQLDEIAAVSEAGFDLQLGILRQACQWGLAGRVWDEMQARHINAASPQQREPYLGTVLPVIAARQLRAAGDESTAVAVEQAAAKVKSQIEPLAALLVAVKQDLDAGKFGDAARRIERDRNVEDVAIKNQLVLQVLDTQLNDSGWKVQLAFSQALQNPLWREQALGRSVFLSVRAGQGEEVFKFLDGCEYVPTEVAAMGRAFVAGLRVRPGQKAGATPAAADAKTSGSAREASPATGDGGE